MELFDLAIGDSPLVAAAIHNGHAVRPEAAQWLALDDRQRLREEDPFTDRLAALAPTRFVSHRSRFEFDLNRPRDKAVYQEPEDAWGLLVWRDGLPSSVVADSLASYDLFYRVVEPVLAELVRRRGAVVVLDLHSYNHRRGGPTAAPDDAAANPEINIGTGSLPREPWGSLVDRFIADLRQGCVDGHLLDVRENVRFRGGHFPRWIHATFGGRVAAIAVEFKKTFMNEWTGELDEPHFAELGAVLRAALPGLLDSLHTITRSIGKH